MYWALDGEWRSDPKYARDAFLAAAAEPGRHQAEAFAALGDHYK